MRRHHLVLAGCITAALVAVVCASSDTDVQSHDERVELRERAAPDQAFTPAGRRAVSEPAPRRER